MRTIITTIAFVITATIILVTSANAASYTVRTYIDTDGVFYATTTEGYDKYHNLSIEGNGVTIHLDKVPHGMGPMFVLSIHTDKVMRNIRQDERVDVLAGMIDCINVYNVKCQQYGTTSFSGEVNEEEVHSIINWMNSLMNNQECEMVFISEDGNRGLTHVSFKNTKLISRAVNDIAHR
jgi:hypothetical protein